MTGTPRFLLQTPRLSALADIATDKQQALCLPTCPKMPEGSELERNYSSIS